MPESAVEGDEFADPAIPWRVWQHIIDWTQSMGPAAQVIIVDDRPPLTADEHVVVRYSGRTGEPPYGLIDGEVAWRLARTADSSTCSWVDVEVADARPGESTSVDSHL